MCDTLNDENDKNIENVNVFEGIMDGLHEALAYEQGEASVGMVIRKRSLSDKEEPLVTTPAALSARNTEDIEMEELDFSPDLQPEPTDTEWPPLMEDLF